jgi:TolB-like protein
MLLAPVAAGQETPANVPQTQPVVVQAAPVPGNGSTPAVEVVPSAPADAAVPQPTQPAKIVVLPFEMVGGKPGDTWIARSIQESVLTDLMTASRSQVVSSTAPAEDSAAAGEIGHKLGARFVVFGQVHVADNAMRVTGQILSTDNDTVVGTLKATSPINDLFTLEDILGDQARRGVGRLEGPQTASTLPQQPPLTIQATGPVQVPPLDSGVPYPGVYNTSPVYPVAPYSPYDSYYPYGDYPYYPGFIYGGIGFGGGFRGHAFGGRGPRGGTGARGGARVGAGHGGGHR